MQNIPLKKDRKRGTGIWAPELKTEIMTKIEEIKVWAFSVFFFVNDAVAKVQFAKVLFSHMSQFS